MDITFNDISFDIESVNIRQQIMIQQRPRESDEDYAKRKYNLNLKLLRLTACLMRK